MADGEHHLDGSAVEIFLFSLSVSGRRWADVLRKQRTSRLLEGW